MTKQQQNIIIPIVLIGAVVGVYLYVKKLSAAPTSKFTKKVPTVKKEVKPAQTVEKQTFPLKVGSNNAYVRQLQDALGVFIDGKFGGAQTLPALKDQTGYSQVDSYDMLQFICEGIFLIDNDFATQSQIFPIMENNYDFVTAWYNAANSGQSTFTYGGTLYSSNGGGKTYDQSYTPIGTDNTPSATDNSGTSSAYSDTPILTF